MQTLVLVLLGTALSAVCNGGDINVAVQHHHVPVATAQVVAQRTQYHSQNDAGEYIYGYVEPNGAKEERKLADGTVLGSYSYASPDGSLITNNYVADEHGFRSNLAPTLQKDNAYAIHNLVDVPAAHAEHHHAPAAVQVHEQVHHAPASVQVHHQQVHHAPASVQVHQQVHHAPAAVHVHHQQAHHVAAVPVVQQQVVDAPPQVHVQEKTYHATQPQVHEVRKFNHDGHVVTKTYSDAHPDVVHQQVKTIVDPKPVVLTHGAVPHDHHLYAASVTPAPGALGVPVSSTPAVAYERVVVSPTPAAHVHEEHYYKPPVVHQKSYHNEHGHHVEKTYAEAGVTVKKTHVDANPTTVVEKTYHEDAGHHAQVVRTTVFDPKPVVTVEKQVHPLPALPVKPVHVQHLEYVHAPQPVVKVVEQHHQPAVVAVEKKVHHGIPLVQAYAAAPAYLEAPTVVKVHQQVDTVPVYIPRAEPLYYANVPQRVAKKVVQPITHTPSYPTYRSHGHKQYHRTPSSSVYIKQYFPSKGRSYGYGRRYGSYSPVHSSSKKGYGRRHSSNRHYYVGH